LIPGKMFNYKLRTEWKFWYSCRYRGWVDGNIFTDFLNA
jgi:hypothetical protein